MTFMKVSIGSSPGKRCVFWDMGLESHYVHSRETGELEGSSREGETCQLFTDNCSSSVLSQLKKLFKYNFSYSSSCYHSKSCSITYSGIYCVRNRERNILSSNWESGTGALITDCNFSLID